MNNKRKTENMKKNNIALHSVAVLAVATLATACSSEDVNDAMSQTTNKQEKVTLIARQPGKGTRVGFTDNGKGYWQTNDAIGVWSKGDNKFNSFALTSGNGETTATFSGTVYNGVGKYAVYPYNENHSMAGTTLTYNLPDSYTYSSVDQTFFPEGKDGNSFGMPMLGTISDDNIVSFKHLAGVVCLQIDKMPAESGTVTVTEKSNKLCGAFTANLTDANPEIKTVASDADKSVTFTYSGATADIPGIFYLPVASGSYNLTVEVASAKKSSTTSVNIEMVRARLQVVNVVTNYAHIINGHKFIDLGLPSGLLWAETNIGAETAYDDGNYYAWGETVPKSTYSEATYTTLGKYGYSDVYEEDALEYTKYTFTDGKTTLDLADDAAYVNWGSGCRMPTLSEMAELGDESNCTWAWVSRTNSAGETINCYKVVSVKNGNIIYLPASGLRDGDGLSGRGSNGYYWASTLNGYDVSYACYLNFDSGYRNVHYYGHRYYGFPVRPVAER